MPRIIIGITGASGAIYGIRFLEVSRELGIESHLIITKNAKEMFSIETDYDVNHVESLASHVYGIQDMKAPIASGSFKTDGMVIVPCSMKTLAGIASGYCDNLLLRAADVCIKEQRRLALVPRETPLSSIHLENMLKLAKIGICILPASPPFYNKPETIDALINHVVGRILDIFGIEHKLYARWGSSEE